VLHQQSYQSLYFTFALTLVIPGTWQANSMPRAKRTVHRPCNVFQRQISGRNLTPRFQLISRRPPKSDIFIQKMFLFVSFFSFYWTNNFCSCSIFQLLQLLSPPRRYALSVCLSIIATSSNKMLSYRRETALQGAL